MAPQKRSSRKPIRTSWDPLARWYDGWVGEGGSRHHRELAIPAVLDLLAPKAGEHILDIGAGQGVLAPFIAKAQAHYVGVDASDRLIQLARKHHGRQGTFIQGDARKLASIAALQRGAFDGVVFLLSIQDMDPLDDILESAAWALRPGGRAVLLMTHPCFRIPRQSGWGWDEGRKLQYRRVDRYLTPLPVPMKAYPGQQSGVTLSFHRPLQDYINSLADQGLLVDQMREIASRMHRPSGPRSKAEDVAHQEIPLFLALRARKVDLK